MRDGIIIVAENTNVMPKPYRTAPQKDGSIRYEFKGMDNVRDGKFYVRGSICWPILNDQTGISEGYVICAAQAIDLGTVIIFESGPFRCIDHILDDEGKIEFQGISSWLNAVWSHYNCNLFYRSGLDETHRSYLTQMLRSTMIKPMPGFPAVDLPKMDDAIATLFAWRTKRKIVMDEESRLHSDLLLWENTGRKIKMPSVEALITLINGYERFRFYPKKYEGV